jgi:exonuclease VII large subunit
MSEQLKSAPKLILKEKTLLLNEIGNKSISAAKELLSRKHQSIQHLEKLSAALDPSNILKRGFALVKQDGMYVGRKSELIKDKTDLIIELYDGNIRVKTEENDR